MSSHNRTEAGLTSAHCASNKLPPLAGLALNADYFLQIPKEHHLYLLTDLQACSEVLPLNKEFGHTFRRLTAAWTKVITNDEVPRVTPPRTRNVQAVAAPARSRGLMLGPELSSFSRLQSEMHAELVRHSHHILTAPICSFRALYIALSLSVYSPREA